MNSITELNKAFSIKGQLKFEEATGGLVIAIITNKLASARVALQGAQLLQWTPGKQAPVIWLSTDARYVRGKSVRGGIPVCWPWFGPHAEDSGLPSHGIARTKNWEVTAASVTEDGSTQLQLRLPEDKSTRELWPYATDLTITITIGETLEIALHTHNRSDASVRITEALHTYFAIGEIDKISVHGLEDTEYVDKVNGGQRKLQQGPVVVDGEIDRVYQGTRADCVIRDTVLKRDIHISKNGSNSTIVWNPWTEKAEQMGDMGEQGYRGMLCVESGNALEDSVSLAPGETHTLRVRYRVGSHR